jgi:predicted dehydrogenase
VLDVGIIGCGRIAEQAHAPAWAELDDLATVTALADPNPARLRVVGEALGIAPQRWYTDYRTMLAERRLDLVDAAVPHVLHRPVVEAAAAAGAHVLSEKPLATTTADVDAILRCADDCGVQLGVVHNYLHLDTTLAAVRWRRQGRIGNPFLYRNEWVHGGHYTGTAGYDPDWRTKAAVAGGGCLLDEGYHSLYLAEHLVDSPIAAVYAQTATYGRPVDVDDSAFVLCRHRSGATSTLTVSWAVQAGGAAVHELHGTGGTVSFTRPGASAAVAGNTDGAWETLDEPYVLHRSFARTFREALETLLAEGRFAVDGRAARRALTLVAAAYRSAATGEVVTTAPAGTGDGPREDAGP